MGRRKQPLSRQGVVIELDISPATEPRRVIAALYEAINALTAN
jgi:hypothetical protein